MRAVVAVAAFAFGSAVAAPVPKELRKQDDKSRLIGTWNLARANVDGKDDPNYFWHSVTFSADGGSCFRYRQSPDEPYDDFMVDLAASPKTVTWRRSAAAAFGARPFEFRNGRLVMSTGKGTNKEPASLEPGPGIIVFEYERADAK
jgi:uncharacterized protein (TIGR03067 family)